MYNLNKLNKLIKRISPFSLFKCGCKNDKHEDPLCLFRRLDKYVDHLGDRIKAKAKSHPKGEAAYYKEQEARKKEQIKQERQESLDLLSNLHNKLHNFIVLNTKLSGEQYTRTNNQINYTTSCLDFRKYQSLIDDINLKIDIANKL